MTKIRTFPSFSAHGPYPAGWLSWGTRLVLIVVVSLYGTLVFVVNHIPALQNSWIDWQTNTTKVNLLCENTVLSNPIRQPASAFSGIVYLLLAIIIFSRVEYKKSIPVDPLRKTRLFYELLLASVLVYVFGCSLFYHASLTRIAVQLDYSAVYAIAAFPCLYIGQITFLKANGTAQSRLQFFYFPLIVIVLAVISVFVPLREKSLAAFVFIMLFFAFSFVAEMGKTGSRARKYLALSNISVMVALIWFELDKYKIGCIPGGYFSLHGLWNLFIGLSTFYFYLYMSESGQAAVVDE
ncbi:hypothetical protein [Mucilaginibacter sp.]|uniref:hypothetical protein n=1 Tax=Mucilaginibacter sp. TaxID=1882438 RepID=UPI000CC2A90C|nr:hypothetical protein [Mucilaginibacter sp.]PLW90971.1 MAG: hypothetical protein C0154_03615 [Mucilaginibacter sp.]PMP66320.1 MAG: hypothetical protein C0191_00575 [Mucilaginibacter sp.]HEK21338.1 hypothetical protein [Bacteroidota bacterium]